jgi:hypothetical protein
MQMDFSKLIMVPDSPDRSEYKESKESKDCKESKDSSSSTPNYFDWRTTYPELEILYKNKDVILEELNGISKVRNFEYLNAICKIIFFFSSSP